ncbi:MAG: sulfotransferase family 2 domain-containing protein [Deltaproteobacteria bacterium]|nr:sulfotransferase family 2 domain-containing protein [Deltaproteobacteria bacterium]
MANSEKKGLPELKGRLGLITSAFAQGWAFYGDNPQSKVGLEIRVNNSMVGRINAEAYRADLRNSGVHPTGYCGYLYSFPELLKAGDKVDIVERDTGRHLAGSPGYYQLKTGAPADEIRGMVDTAQEDLKFFFIHIPKTAGTSFRLKLYEIFHQDQIYPNQQMIRASKGYPHHRIFWNMSGDEKTNIKVFMGHYPSIVHKLMGENVHRLVFLRHPIQRTISNLNHFRNLGAKHKNASLEQVYLKSKSHISNLQVRYFMKNDLDEDLDLSQPEALDREHLRIAKKNLSQCEFIGITERFSESIELLNRMYDFNIQEIATRNVSRNREKVSYSLMRQIRKDNKFDMELYRFALRLFQERLRQTD